MDLRLLHAKVHCGHIWALLWRFEKVPLLSLNPAPTQVYPTDFVREEPRRETAPAWANCIHRQMQGNIQVLHCVEKKSDRRLLEIDVKIRSLALHTLDSARNLRADWQELEERQHPQTSPRN